MKICKRCVMNDLSDETITFDEKGYCNYCSYAIKRMDDVYFPNKIGNEKLLSLINNLKRKNKNKKYDCLMGISGGLDSAYLAYLGSKKWGLRILAIHIDDGFDSPIAKENIDNLCSSCGIELITVRPDEKEYNDMLKAFIRANVPNIAMPQDNALFAALYKCSRKYKIKTFLSGANFALESITQRGNTHNAYDKKNILCIHKMFGDVKNKGKVPLISCFNKYVLQKYFYRIKSYRPLDFIDYNKEKAIDELKQFCNFNYYEGKHYESIFTRFMQEYWLPVKFGVDKRTSHFSSLIVSKQMTREQAIKLLEEKQDPQRIKDDINFVLNKLNMSEEEFEMIMAEKPKKHTDYKYSKWIKFSKIAIRFRRILSD